MSYQKKQMNQPRFMPKKKKKPKAQQQNREQLYALWENNAMRRKYSQREKEANVDHQNQPVDKG